MAVRIFTAKNQGEAEEIVNLLERRAIEVECEDCDIRVDDEQAMQALELIRNYYDLNQKGTLSESALRNKARRKQTKRTLAFVIFVALISFMAILIAQNM